MVIKNEKETPLSGCGVILDGEGKVIRIFPDILENKLRNPDVSLRSMLKDSDAARLSEFCAVSPSPVCDPASYAANTAIFDLSSGRFTVGVAVKDRAFSGSNTVLYLFEGKKDPSRIPSLLLSRFPEKIRNVVSVLNGMPAEPPPGFPFPELAEKMKVRIGIDGTESLEKFISSLTRKLSAFPELCCGTVELKRSRVHAPLSSGFPAGAFSAIFSLLVSTLNSRSASHRTEVSVIPRGAAAEVVISDADHDGASHALFTDCPDILSLAARLPGSIEILSLAAYLAGASGIPVDVNGGDVPAGFSLTVLPDSPPEEFKDRFPSFEPDLILGELSGFIPKSEAGREEG